MFSQHNSIFKVSQYSQLRCKARFTLVLFLLAFSGQLFAALNIAVEVTSSPSVAGEMVVVRLTVTNPSTTTASDVRIEMLYPDNLTPLFDVALSDSGDCTDISGGNNRCNSGETVFWNLGDLSPGSGKTVYLTPAIAASASDGDVIDFIAQGFENGVLQATASQSIEVQSNQVLTLAIDANQEPVAANSELTYDIIYSQVGTVAITNTEIALPLPAGTSFVSASGGGDLVGSDVVWNIGVLNPGQAGHRQVKIQLGAGITNGNILSIDAATITGIANFIPQQAQVIETTRVDDLTKIDFALTTNTNPVRRNDFLHTYLTVTNKTAQVMTGVRVELFYPNGLLPTLDIHIFDNGDCTSLVGGAFSCDSGETVFWDIGDLQPGVGKTVYIVPTVSWVAANVDGLMLPFIARAMTNNSGDHWQKSTIVIEDSRMLNIAINAKQEPVAPNAQLVYDITYSNTGANATTNTQLKLPLPVGTSFISADAEGNLVGNDIIWDIGLLNPGQKGHRRLALQLDASITSGEIIVVDALTLSGDANFVTHQAIALASTRVESLPQLDLAIVTNSNPVTVGEFIYTSLTITNKTNAVMTGVRLELFYPQELSQINTTRISDGGRCTSTVACSRGDTLYWDLPNLNPGTGKTVYLAPIPFVLTLADTDGTFVPFIARAFADGTSERWERNTVVLEENRLLNLNVIANKEPVASNQQLKYDINYSNQGIVATTNTELIFPLPANTTFVTADAGGNLVGTDVIWDIGTLNPGQGAHKQVTVQLGASVTNGDIIETDTVTLTGEENLTSHQARALSSTRVEDLPAIGLAISTGTSPVRLDETPYIHLTATNKTTQLMTGVRVELLIHFGLNGFLISALTDNANCTSASGFCQPGETVFWELGSLAPGTGKTVSLTSLPGGLFGSTDGRQISFNARAFADSQTDRWVRSTVIIEQNRALSLTIDADQEPNIIDASISYNLTFGNRGDTTANGIELRFPLPDNSTFISTEAGGMLVNNEVIWNIGTLNPGEGSRRRVTLQLDNSINVGDIMEINKASISTVNHKTMASSILRVKHNNLLDLWLDLDADVVLPNDTLDVNLSVNNQSASTMPNIELSLSFPNHLNQLADSLISNGGDCNNVSGSDLTCNTPETVIWNLGNIIAGNSSLQNIPPTIEQDSLGTFNGAVVQFYAKAKNTSPDRSYVSRSLLIGAFVPAAPESDLIFIDGFE
ncbi:MAG: DUF11 domain-containing protein [Proteobacteria bacterium]|nr:DUF11 domain-containing protein [Pseudomonadota bacterium]